MSAFAGLFLTSMRPAQAEELSFLTQTPNEAGSSLTVVSGPCVFTTIYDAVKLEKALLIGYCRLDNRQELIQKLGSSASFLANPTDAQIIILAWRRWGPDCCSHLIGDFAFALWDEQSRSLLLARDVFGPSELYYHVNSDRLMFANRLGYILQDPAVPQRPNLEGLALSTLLVASADGSQSLYEGIRQLPSANYLVVDDRGIRMRQYWSTDLVDRVQLKKSADYQEALIEHLEAAVSCRLAGGPVGILLSGGLDSSSIASIAAHRLQQQGKSLQAYTSVPAYPVATLNPARFCTDEYAHAAAVAQQIGNTLLHRIDSKDLSPMSGMRTVVDILLHPLFAVSNAHWLVKVYQAMQQDGIKLVLSGQNGNATISWHGSDVKLIRELAAAGRMMSVAREVAAMQKSYGWNTVNAIRRLVIAPFVPEPILVWRRRMLDRSDSWMTENPLNAAFMGEIRLRERLHEGQAYRFSRNSPSLRKFMLPIGISSGGGVGAALAAHFGLQLSDPSSDRRLIEFCLGIPEEEYVHAGEHRLLIRQAMRDRLPREVLDSKQYGLQSADLLARLKASSQEVERELYLAEKSELSRYCLDLDKIRQSFEGMLKENNLGTLLSTSRILMKGLAISMFLQRFET